MLPSGLPRIIVGTARMGTVLPAPLVAASDRTRAFVFLDSLLDMGCSAFDLAASYQLGGTERLFGSWMASRRNRGRLYLISKGGHPLPIVRPHRLTPTALRADLHASLRRLRTERLDLYLLHRDDETAPLEPILEALTTFQRQGKLAAWGVSNWTHTRIAALVALARSAGVAAASASSPHFSLLEWAKVPWPGSVSIAGDPAARAYHEETQLPVLAWSPLGSGFFSVSRRGKPGGGRRSGAYASPANVARRQRAETLAQRYRCAPAQIALAYLFHQGFPVFAVVSARSPEHMRSNLEATTLRLSVDDVRWLETGHAAPAS